MNTLHKFLTISFIAVFFFISGLTVDFVGAQNTAAGTAASRIPEDPVQSRYLRFGRLTTEDGLSGDQAYHVAQDSYGFMWFATANGLSRYDGSSVKVYRHDPDDPSSLSHSAVRAMIIDRSGDLWLGTWGGGLNKYDREKDAFISYQNDPDDPHSLSHNIIRSVYEDGAGMIWVGTNTGLNKFDRESRKFTRYLHDPDDPNSLSHNLVWSILEDSGGVLWVGTEGGLNRFDPETEQFIHYRHDPDDPASLSDNTVRAIIEDRSGVLWLSTAKGLCKFNRDRTRFTRYLKDATDPKTLSSNLVTWVYEDRAGRLWVSTWGGGLNQFERETETFTHYRHDPADPYSLGADTVFQVYEDQQGMFWIASVGGISIFDGRGKPFQHYRSISYLPNTLSHNIVRALHAGQAGVVWVGTSGGGLNRLDRHTEAFTHYRHDPADPNSLSTDTVRAIYEDRMGMIWVGTSQRGLINRFDPDTERFTRFRHDAANPRSMSNGSIMGINEDRTGTLWIATWGGGLNAFDRETEQFTRYQHDPADSNTLSNNQVTTVFEDRAGELWIGTMGGGLNKFNREAKRFTRYQHVSTKPQSLVQDSVTSICEDRTGTLWIGTTGGLDKFDRTMDQFTHYTTANGLPSEVIWGILEDEQGRLWISTSNGLSRFDPRTESFRNYTVSDGLQSNTFLNFSSYSKSQSGEMFFGGSNGFNAFYPDQIVDNLTPPPVLITDFQLANKPVPIGTDSVLQKSILETDELVLSFRDRVLSFEFAVLNYRAPQQNRYKYRMEGFEKEWNETDRTRRFATYTNLDPGDYVFRVIGSNNDGIWNEEGASIHITVTPPWWETLWFRISMVVVAIGLLAGGFRWRVSTIEARSRRLEIQVQRRTQELEMANRAALEAQAAAETANRAKNTFLANMSHELRTPLNAILGFGQVMGRDPELPEKYKQNIEIMSHSGEHLLSLIDEILELSKIESGRVTLNKSGFNLHRMVETTKEMFRLHAEKKGLSLKVERGDGLPEHINADERKLNQILSNLLSNAIKYTNTGGVTLRASCRISALDSQSATEDGLTSPVGDQSSSIRFEVADTGIGIAAEDLDKIFEPFSQLSVGRHAAEGAGLGLALARQYVKAMGGTFSVKSLPGKGTTFTVELPYESGLTSEIAIQPLVRQVVGLKTGQPRYRILIAEDNTDSRVMLKKILEQVGFQVREAENGQEAVALFKSWNPHLIWMDIRMPVMDGLEATKQIRECTTRNAQPATRNPIIIAITASVFEEDKDKVLAGGCDDFVRKPFQVDEIFVKMAKYLDVRYIYQDPQTPGGKPVTPALTSADLAGLPKDLVEQINTAAKGAMTKKLLDLLQQIPPDYIHVADAMVDHISQYQFSKIVALTEKENKHD